MSFSTELTRDELDAALTAFHNALDAYSDHRIAHGREPGWVNDDDAAIVEALLRFGWQPPSHSLSGANPKRS